MIKVKGVIGSSRFPKPAGYSSWLEYWEKKTGKKAYFCAATDCWSNKNLVGGHVQKVDGFDKSWYIVPICSGCNHRTDEFYVEGPLVPVPSNY